MTTEAEAITPQVVDGSRQLAIEIKSQRELALANPRDERKVLAACLAELEMAPEYAEDAYYSIPYNEGKENETLVEGLSVKASRAVVRRWGNCATAARVGAETDEFVDLEGIFADFETNVFMRRTVRVKKTYLARGSKLPVPLNGTMLQNAIQAGLSKAERNAALSGLPEYLKDKLFLQAKLIAGRKDKGTKTEAERLDACYKGFAKFGVTPERVAAYVAEKLAGKSTDEIIGTMKGVFNALKEKHTTAEETFPTTKPEASGAKGAIKASDIPGAEL